MQHDNQTPRKKPVYPPSKYVFGDSPAERPKPGVGPEGPHDVFESRPAKFYSPGQETVIASRPHHFVPARKPVPGDHVVSNEGSCAQIANDAGNSSQDHANTGKPNDPFEEFCEGYRDGHEGKVPAPSVTANYFDGYRTGMTDKLSRLPSRVKPRTPKGFDSHGIPTAESSQTAYDA